jgi:hypothetical protein
MGNNKNKGMPTMNDKMITSDNGVLKKHVENTKGVRLNMKIFILNNKEHEDIESTRYNARGHQGH